MKKLTKTIMWALVGVAMGYFIGGDDATKRMVMMIGMAGFPSGWRVVGKFGIIPLNMMGVAIHLLISIIVGWITLPYELLVGMLELRREKIKNENL